MEKEVEDKRDGKWSKGTQ